jgi:hypothetical protein
MVNSGSDEAMKPLLRQKIKKWSDDAFNAGKEIEAMKRLTLHSITSSLHRLIASIAQLWVWSAWWGWYNWIGGSTRYREEKKADLPGQGRKEGWSSRYREGKKAGLPGTGKERRLIFQVQGRKDGWSTRYREGKKKAGLPGTGKQEGWPAGYR